MAKMRGTALYVGLTCAATILGHAGLNWQHERRIEVLLSQSMVSFCACPDPPPVDELFSDEVDGDRSPPLQLAGAHVEAEAIPSEQPADALHPWSRPLKTAASARATRQQAEDEAAVRQVIEDEMSETSAEERDIWFEELKSLPAEAVRDMLQVRKHLRVLTPDHQLGGPGQLPPLADQEVVEKSRDVPAEPAGQIRSPHGDEWWETREALRQAIAWSLHNLANAATPGYKRSRVVLGDAYVLDDAFTRHGDASSPTAVLVGAGCRIRSLHVDLQPGEIVETGRELDMAIDGEGFFVVQHAESERTFYTRCGAWLLDSHRQVSQSLAGEKYLLDPPLVIPPAASAVEISPEGAVSVRMAGQEQKTVVGQIHLVRFDAPTELTPHGNCLFYAPERLQPRIEPDGGNVAANLKQHALEQSNVQQEQEQAERESWEAILQALPSTEVPRTARQGTRFPR